MLHAKHNKSKQAMTVWRLIGRVCWNNRWKWWSPGLRLVWKSYWSLHVCLPLLWWKGRMWVLLIRCGNRRGLINYGVWESQDSGSNYSIFVC